MRPNNGGERRAAVSAVKARQLPIVGPVQSAIRAKCDDAAFAGLNPIFARIGADLDRIVATDAGRAAPLVAPARIVVSVSDVRWGDRVLSTQLFFDEMAVARLSFGSLDDQASLSKVVELLWADWSCHARRCFRRRELAWNAVATTATAGLLCLRPDEFVDLANLCESGGTPIVAVALAKRQMRALVVELPAWARTFGVVAGNA
ncbi:hypothetical protein ACVWZL_001300 [Bradyrhizobium sp. GM2.4]